jgi:hypothetical protein
VTQELHISVTPVGNDKYLVRTERVASGVPIAEEQVQWPVDQWLQQARYLMNDPLLGLLQGYGISRVGGFELPVGHSNQTANGEMESLSLVEFGQQLYNALFQRTLRDSWVMAQGIAQHRGEVLRLRLGLKGTQLPRLPWEVLHGGDRTLDHNHSTNGLGIMLRPIATGTDVIFSRYQPGTGLIGSVPFAIDPDQPLRILMAIASPPDQERLQLKREALHLQEELQSAQAAGAGAEGLSGKLPDIQLTILDQPGREELTQALEQGQYHVLHYAGHSNLGPAGGDLYLVNSRTGLTEILSGDDLAGLLVNNGIRMAVFNSCRGAHVASATEFSEGDRTLAEALICRGVPAVLAMAERIPDDVALSLTRLFYRNLKLGYPIDLSISRARQGLLTAYGSQQLYWALPILYMHPDCDGYLTSRDRTLDNPADRLLLLSPSDDQPIFFGEEKQLNLQEQIPAIIESEDELEMISNAVLATDDDDLNGLMEDYLERYDQTFQAEETEEFDDTEAADDNPSYEEATEVVASLIKQLSQQQAQQQSSELISVPPDEITQADSLESEQNGHDQVTYPISSRYSAQNGDRPLDAPYLPVVREQKSNQITPFPKSSVSTQPKAPPATPEKSRSWLPLVAVVSVAAIASGLWLHAVYQSRGSNLHGLWPTPTTSSSPIAQGTDSPTPTSGSSRVLASPNPFSTVETNMVAGEAVRAFSGNNVSRGEQAVEALLERGALQEATAALEAVPKGEISNPDINFLRGRLAWEQVRRGNSDYSYGDARRFWEIAVKGKPDFIPYRNALGFALYADNKLKDAKQVWCRSLVLLHQSAPSSLRSPAEACPAAQRSPAADDPERDAILTTNAGLALTLKKASETNAFGKPEALLQQSIILYQFVLDNDPVQFEPDNLPKNWLWTDTAVTEWRSLATR